MKIFFYKYYIPKGIFENLSTTLELKNKGKKALFFLMKFHIFTIASFVVP